MEDQIYEIRSNYIFHQVKSFTPQPENADLLFLVKKILHQTNKSSAGNFYNYFRYEFFNRNGIPANLRIKKAELIEISPEYWVMNGLPCNMKVKIKDGKNVIMELTLQKYSSTELINNLLSIMNIIGGTFMVGGSGRSGYEGYWMYKGVDQFLELLRSRQYISAEIVDKLRQEIHII